MKKTLYYGTLLVLIGVFLFSGYKIAHYMMEKNRSEQITQEATQYIQKDDTKKNEGEADLITVDFDALREENSDVVAWLYGADTGLNYPVVQGSDNDYYLYRLLDGSSNSNGTLFMDYQCAGDFSMGNTLIYGHNMRSGNMFGHLVSYKKQEFYDEHPYLYILTPDGSYRMELLAGCVVDNDADVYSFDLTPDQLEGYMARSTFTTQYKLSQEYRYVTLSTCSYEYENARYVVIGQMVPLD